jgi:agmatinase
MNYGGLDEEYTGYDHSQIAILPVSYDGTSTWIKGADKGPEAILTASAHMELYDIETDTQVFEKGIYTGAPILHDGTPDDLAVLVENEVSKLLNDRKFPVLLGGEHSVSIGSFRAFARHYRELSILQLDAHSDLRPVYQGSSCNHACVMARAREVASITQVGIRSMCEEEKVNLDPRRVFFAHQIRRRSKEYVYITIDLDVLDPSVMPSTGTPEPGGLLYEEVIELLKYVNRRHRIVGFDVVELCPNKLNKSPDFLASKLIYQLLSLIFNKRK